MALSTMSVGMVNIAEYSSYGANTNVTDRYLNARLGLTNGAPETWLDEVHPEYAKEARKWVYARDHYTGDTADPEKIRYYLVQKAIGETVENYEERVALADYTPHMGTLIDEMAGMLFLSDDDTNREWGSLGDPEVAGTRANLLSFDADEMGNPWETIWKLVNIELTAIHRTWLFVDGGADRQNSHVVVVPAENVRNWKYTDGVLSHALIIENVDSRTDLQDQRNASVEQRYLYLTVDGWQRWMKVKDGSDKPAVAVPLTGPENVGSWEYYTRGNSRTIPLYCAELPLRRHLGYALARKANAIFNQESARDNLIRYANFPLLNVIGNDKTYDKVANALSKGARALQNMPGTQAHHFIAPQSAPAQIATTILERKVMEFYRVGFKSFEEIGSNRERLTATEIKSRLAGGIYAFLILQKASLEDAENQIMYFLEQTYFPGDRSKWGDANVKRSNNFTPLDVDALIESYRKRYFGDGAVVPIGRTGRINAAIQVAEWDGLDVDVKEIEANVDFVQLTTALKEVPAFISDVPIPAVARAEMAVRFLMATGYLKPDESVEMGDGTKKPLLDVMRIRALAMADAQDQNALKAAEVLGPPTPKPTPTPAGTTGSTKGAK